MDIVITIVLMAAVFGLCFLVDKGFAAIFRNRSQHRSGKAVRLNMGDIATVRRSNMETKLLRLKERSFFDVLNMKFKCN